MERRLKNSSHVGQCCLPDSRKAKPYYAGRPGLKHGCVSVDDGRQVLIGHGEASDGHRVFAYGPCRLCAGVRVPVEQLHLLVRCLERGLGVQRNTCSFALVGGTRI